VTTGGKPRTAAAGVSDVEADVISALVNLGYDGRAAEEAVAAGQRQVGIGDLEKLLRAALGALTLPKKTR
jgi:Holliday junction resolvasome RuvABC DNA-binding subunit